MKAFGKVWLGIGLISIGLGLSLLFVASITGASWRKASTFSYNESYEGVKSLDFRLNYGEISIVEGDQFRIDAYGLYGEYDFDSRVVNGVWVIEDIGVDNINVFGFKLPIIFRFGKNDAPDIVITIPEDFTAEDIRIRLGAGLLAAENLRSKTGSFQVDAGKMTIDHLNITDKSDYSVGAGYMQLKDVNVKDIIVQCGLGYIEMDGKVIGDNTIRCDVGRINMDLIGDKNNYAFEIDSDIGNVIMNGREYHNTTVKKTGNEKAEGSFLLDCSIGNITLFMNE